MKDIVWDWASVGSLIEGLGIAAHLKQDVNAFSGEQATVEKEHQGLIERRF